MSHDKPTHARFVDLEGQRFTRLTVIAFGGEGKWTCRCDCGATTSVDGRNLRNGHTRSCGCLSSEVTRDRNLKHGEARTPLYACWNMIKARCTNPKTPSYPDYGGRGIRICERYASSYEALRDDLGEQPFKGATIDRNDNEGHYSCGRCPDCRENGWRTNLHWASRTHQARNRRSTSYLTFGGETLPVTEWAERTGIAYHLIRYRLAAGWTIEETLTTPAHHRSP